MNSLSPQTIKERSHFIKKTRDFFYKMGFIEVDTPFVVNTPSLEPHIDPYTVKVENGKEKYLITSPEYSMKKILGMGCEKIFEIAHSWRSDERGHWHSSEFLMLEWYWVDSDLEMLIEFSHQLIENLLDKKIDKQIISIEKWFKEHFNHGHTRKELEKNPQFEGLSPDKMEYEELFFRLFLNTEERLNDMGLVFFTDYPEELRAYSTVSDNRAQRFEIYLNGVELANAFNEEKSKIELEKILKKEQYQREILNKENFIIDKDFTACLDHIKPNITGIAMGLDRLFALSKNAKSLSEISFYQQRK